MIEIIAPDKDWNVRGLLKTGKLAAIEQQQQQIIQLYFIGPAETHWARRGYLTTATTVSYILLGQRHAIKKRNGNKRKLGKQTRRQSQ